MYYTKFSHIYVISLAHMPSKTSLSHKSIKFDTSILYDILLKFSYSIISNFAPYGDDGYL